MAYTTEEIQTYYEDWLRTKAYIAVLDAAVLGGLESAATQKYSFDSGSGRQEEQFRSPQELLDRLSSLEAKRNKLYTLWNRRAVQRTQVRR